MRSPKSSAEAVGVAEVRGIGTIPLLKRLPHEVEEGDDLAPRFLSGALGLHPPPNPHSPLIPSVGGAL